MTLSGLWPLWPAAPRRGCWPLRGRGTLAPWWPSWPCSTPCPGHLSSLSRAQHQEYFRRDSKYAFLPTELDLPLRQTFQNIRNKIATITILHLLTAVKIILFKSLETSLGWPILNNLQFASIIEDWRVWSQVQEVYWIFLNLATIINLTWNNFKLVFPNMKDSMKNFRVVDIDQYERIRLRNKVSFLNENFQLKRGVNRARLYRRYRRDLLQNFVPPMRVKNKTEVITKV